MDGQQRVAGEKVVSKQKKQAITGHPLKSRIPSVQTVLATTFWGIRVAYALWKRIKMLKKALTLFDLCPSIPKGKTSRTYENFFVNDKCGYQKLTVRCFELSHEKCWKRQEFSTTLQSFEALFLGIACVMLKTPNGYRVQSLLNHAIARKVYKEVYKKF